MFDLLMVIISDIQPGRMFETLVFLALLWYKVRPHLETIEKRMKGLEDALNKGLAVSEVRFETIERKINTIDKKIVNLEGANNEKLSIN